MKNINYKELKSIQNKYDLGKIGSTGYQSNPNIVDTSGFSTTNQASMSNDISNTKTQTIWQGINKAGQMASTLTGIYNGFTSASTTNLNNAINAVGIDKVAAYTKDAGLTQGVNKALEQGGVDSTSKGALSTAGKVASVAGAVYSAYNLANDIASFSDRIKGSDIEDMSSKTTQSKNGVMYTGYGGFDEQGIKDYTSAQNTQSKMSMSLDGAGFGASVGSLIAPGIGTIVGGVLGGIGGLVGSIFGSNSRRNKVLEEIRRTKEAQNNFNTQAESEAGSQGLRNEFYATHADKGKNPSSSTNIGKPGIVHTAHGIVPGVIYGLAGKGESIYHPEDGAASVFTEGKKRVDNIPTGVPMNETRQDWNETVIFGNNKNPYTGNTFAEDAKPYAKVLEKQDKEHMNYLNKHTKEINRRNAMKKLNTLADQQKSVRQFEQSKFNEGKPHYGELAGVFLPHLEQMGPVLASRPSYTDASRSAYVDDNTGAAHYALLQNSRLDPTQALSNAEKTNRSNIYSINNSSLSDGVKQKMLLSNSQQNLNNRNNIIQDYDTKSRAYVADSIKQWIASKQNSAARMQQALESQFARNDKAQAIHDNFMQQYWANMAGQFGSLGKDWMAYNQYNQARNFQNSILGLYGGNINNDIAGIMKGYTNSNPGSNYYYNPSLSITAPKMINPFTNKELG